MEAEVFHARRFVVLETFQAEGERYQIEIWISILERRAPEMVNIWICKVSFYLILKISLKDNELLFIQMS